MHFDIFNNDAFSVSQLTRAIINTPYQPQALTEMGLFTEQGISTTSMSIENIGSTINLVPSGARGTPAGKIMTGDKRKLLSINTVHLPQRTAILADEVQNLRTFGSETELETAQNLMNKKLAKMRRDLDTTIEYQRMGALKGQVLDADGSTVLLDLFDTFGVTKTEFVLALGTSTTKVRNRLVELKRTIERNLGGLMYTNITVLCSASFFDALVGHGDVEKAYVFWQGGQMLQQDLRKGFQFAGITFVEYRGVINGIPFIPDGQALAIPEGVPDLFLTAYAPADYMETVNTIGLPYYAKQELMSFNKGIEVEAQSNPISICTRPQVPVTLKLS